MFIWWVVCEVCYVITKSNDSLIANSPPRQPQLLGTRILGIQWERISCCTKRLALKFKVQFHERKNWIWAHTYCIFVHTDFVIISELCVKTRRMHTHQQDWEQNLSLMMDERPWVYDGFHGCTNVKRYICTYIAVEHTIYTIASNFPSFLHIFQTYWTLCI